MRSEILGIQHKNLLAPRLKAVNTPLSEYAFANLYLFRSNHRYEVIIDKEIFIKGTSYDGHTYLMPTIDIRKIEMPYLVEMMHDEEYLYPIPEEWLSIFEVDKFHIAFDEGEPDYVYTVEKMTSLKGRHLHKKRNLLKQFLEMYSHDAQPLTNDKIDDARFILNDWLAASGSKEGDSDYGPCAEALERYEELVLCGGIYYADKEPAGFVLGEELNAQTFVIHFAKARIKFKGIYQFMFNNFAGILPSQYKYLNLEQDLQNENLRVFKSSYMPDALLKKARVSFKR